MTLLGERFDSGQNPGDSSPIPDSLFWNSAHEDTRLPPDVVLTPDLLAAEVPHTTDTVVEALHHGIERGPESEDARWRIVAHRAKEMGIPIVEQTGIALVLEDSGIEITEPTIDPATYEEAA